MLKLSGVITALATPFRDGQLDQEAYAQHIDRQIDGGVSGLCPVGTTGEAATLSKEERHQAVQIAAMCADGEIPVIAGAGGNSTQATIESVAQVRDAGADAALLVTPFYNKPTQGGLVAHYRAVAQAHPGFPLVAYNVPGRTGVDLLPDTLKQLADIEEVIGLKEATGNIARIIDIVDVVGTDRFSLLSGDDFTAAAFVAMGGHGVISVSSNLVPGLMSEMIREASLGDIHRAAQTQIQLNQLHHALFIESNPIPVKAALNILGHYADEIRLPLTPLTEAHRSKLTEILADLKLLDSPEKN